MARTYFGTDGIRGTANRWPMTPDIAMRVGMAAGKTFVRGKHRHRVLIGKDTRLSGYTLEPALVAGFAAVGMDIMLLGPMPTPGVAMLTRSLRADLGVMLSASHNPYEDNGIKLFGPDGFKLHDDIEMSIEQLMDSDALMSGLATNGSLGRVKRLEDVQGRYIEFAKSTFPRRLRLDDLRIVIDCAHGAAYRVAPAVLWELGAEVITIGVDPDGTNINVNCGSTFPDQMVTKIREVRADIGIALDGDADRVIIADENGTILDGDQLMALVAKFWKKRERLRGGTVVATVMSNLGLERFLSDLGLKLERTMVGDRYVVERMRAIDANVGGEQSGHIVLTDFTTTGDGLIAALQVLALMVGEGQPLSELAGLVERVPQKLTNVRFEKGIKPLDDKNVQKTVTASQRRLGTDGRVVVRASGTESMIRIMVECEDARLVEQITLDISEAVKVATQKVEA